MSRHRLDVADRAAVAGFPDVVAAEHAGVDVLVNNAGVAVGGTFEQVSDEDFEWLFEINFWGVVRMTRAFLPLLRASDDARVVNLSSVFGLVAPPEQVAYAASKFAVRGFSEALRHELEGSGVGVTVVHPGGVATSIAEKARVPAGVSEEEIARRHAKYRKLLRLPPEVAGETIVRGIERRQAAHSRRLRREDHLADRASLAGVLLEGARAAHGIIFIIAALRGCPSHRLPYLSGGHGVPPLQNARTERGILAYEIRKTFGCGDHYLWLELYAPCSHAGFYDSSLLSRSTALSRFILLNLNIGMVTFVLGIGVLLAKEWARISLLMSLIALLAIHTVVLFLPRQSNFLMPILNFVLIVLLFLISWLKLTQPSVKELFSCRSSDNRLAQAAGCEARLASPVALDSEWAAPLVRAFLAKGRTKGLA